MEHIGLEVKKAMSELASPKKRIFPSMTKAAIQKRCSWILKNYKGGVFLEGFDKKMLLALIDNHPEKAKKVGCGIQAIMIVDDGKRGKHFEIHREDGSRIDFSYRTCLRGTQSKLERFRAACRTAIISDIREFRDEILQGNPCCPHRNIPLNIYNCIVDHMKPKTFNMIVANFIGSHGLDIDQIEIAGDTQRVFVNSEIAWKFRKYHRENATLQLVYWEANNCECR